jgi:uncharacterized protein YidB (DUF937 family)
MDLFGTISKMVGGGAGADGSDGGGDALAAISHLIQGHGGLGGLLEKFKSAGLADKVKSWIGLGPNQEITAAEVERVLGGPVLDKIAATTGIDKAVLSAKLSEYLPKVIDKLTPTGQVPPDAAVTTLLEALEANTETK